MRNLKDRILKRLIASGKKHKKLIYPLVVIITLFLTTYHSMKQLAHELVHHKYRSRIIATCLILSIIFTQSAWYILAATQQEVQTDNKLVTAVQGFGEEITNQIIEEGMEESSIVFPETMNITVETTQLVLEPETTTEVETTSVVETTEPMTETTEPMTETSVPETTEPTTETSVPETTEPTTETSVPETTVPPVTEPAPSSEVPSTPAPSSEVPPTPESSSVQEVIPSSSAEVAVSGSVLMPLYYAAPESTATVEVIEQEQEAPPAAENSTVDLEMSLPQEVVPDVPETTVPTMISVQEEIAITWQLQDGKVFDSSREREESVYVYQAVLPQGYALAEGVSMPRIMVTVETYLYPFEQSVTIDDVVISVSAPEGVFPKNSILSVRKVEKQEEIASAIDDAVENKRNEDSQTAKAYTYDIKVVDAKENEIEPYTEYGKVKVSFAMAKAPNYFSELNIYHVEGETAGNLSAETMNVSVKQARTALTNRNVVATTETEGFSYYVVEFSYGDLQYVLDGNSSIMLSTIMNTIGLNGTVVNAVSSAPDLFVVSQNAELQWMLTAKAAFDSRENLKLSMEDGSEYVIAVTDASSIYHIGSTDITTTVDAAGDGWSWNFKEKVLTFTKNMNIEAPRLTKPAQGSSDPGLVAISLPAGSKITVQDGITVNVYAKVGDAVYSPGELTVLGTGTLNLYACYGGVAANWSTGNITGIPNDDATTGDGISTQGSITIGAAGIGPVVNVSTGAPATRNAIASLASGKALVTQGGTVTLLAGKIYLPSGEIYMDSTYLSAFYIPSLGNTYSSFTYTLKEGNWYYSKDSGQYAVVYNANDGYSTKAKESVTKGQSVVLSDAVRPGFNFTGWYTAASGGTKVGAVGESYKPSASTVLYAQWTNTVEANAATDIVGSSFVANWKAISDVNNYQLYVYTDAACTTLLGGYNGKTVSGTSYKVTGLRDNTNYYYRIKPIHTSYSSAPFSNSMSVKTINEYNAVIWTNGKQEDKSGGTFATRTPYGTYTFVPTNSYSKLIGWYDSTGEVEITDSNKDSYGVSQISADGLTITASSSVANVSVVAKVTRNYTVTYEQNGQSTALYPSGCDMNGVDAGSDGFGYPALQRYAILENGSKTLEAPISKDCMAWTTEPNGTGETYQPGDTVELTKDLILYAQWEKYPTLSYHVNAQAGSYTGTIPDSVTQSAHEKFVAAENTGNLKRTGYELVGWEESATPFGKAKFELGEEITVEKDTTLYAVWKLAMPGKVTALEATVLEPKKAEANWVMLIEKTSGYLLQVALDEEFTQFVEGYEELKVEGEDKVKYYMEDLESGTQYYYRVAAYNTDGTQTWYSGNTDEIDKIAWSETISFKTPIQVNVFMPKKVQVNLAVGITGVNYSTFEADLRKELMSLGATNENIKISATSAGSSSSTSSFAWQKYDHTVDNENISPPIYYLNVGAQGSGHPYTNYKNHIVINSSGDMTFYGYGSSAYKDFYLNPNTQSTRKEIEFNVTEGEAYDAFDGAGFLINASTSGTYPNQRLNGYLIFLQYNGSGQGNNIKLFELNNVNTKSLQAETSAVFDTVTGTSSMFGGTVTLKASTPAGSYGAYKYRKIHIKVLPDSLQMWYSKGTDSSAQKVNLTSNNPSQNDYLIRWNGSDRVVLEPRYDTTDRGDVFRGGFGPLASYRSHGCEKPTYFTMSNITLEMDTVKSLTEVIREPDWDSNYDSYLVNLNEVDITDFSEEYSTAEIIMRLRSDEVTYIGWCSEKNQAASQEFLKKIGDGTLVNVKTGNYTSQIKEIATYIMSRNKHGVAEKSTISTNADPNADLIRYNYLIGEPWVLEGIYGTNLEDKGWTVTKSPTDFDHLGDGNEIIEPGDKILIGENSNLLKEDFEKPGYYQVYRTEDYQKDGKRAHLYLQIRANKAPETGFTTTTDGANCTVVSTAKDDMAEFEEQIVVTKVSDAFVVKDVKQKATGSASEVTFSFSFSNDIIYMIRQTLKDRDGTTRSTTKQFVVKTSACTPPFNSFALDKTDLITPKDTLSILDASQSTDGSAVVATYLIKNGTTFYKPDVDGKLITSTENEAKFTLSAGTSKENMDISALPSGTYEISMSATASAPGKAEAKSEEITKTFTVTKGYKITFDLEGGTLGGSSSKDVDYKLEKKPYSMPAETPTKEGNRFAGWKQGEGSTVLWEKENYTTDAAVTMTAQWKPAVDIAVKSNWIYYNVNTNNSHSHDAAAQLPKTVKVKLQWREKGATVWSDYNGVQSAYKEAFEIENTVMTACEIFEGRSKIKEGSGEKTVAGLEPITEKGVVLEYRLQPQETRTLYTAVFTGENGTEYIEATGNKEIMITSTFAPETFEVVMKADFTKVPSALMKKDKTSLSVMPQFVDNANSQTWTDMQQFATALTLNNLNNHQISEPIWKWEMKNVPYSNGVNVKELVINGKAQKQKEDGTIVLPIFLQQDVQSMKYEDGKTDAQQSAIVVFYTMNEQYFEYDEVENELTLKEDVVLDDTLEVDGDLNLDLNGNELKGPEGKDTIHLSDGKLDIKDSSPSGGGSIVGGNGKDSEDGTTDGGNGGDGIKADGGTVATDEKVTISGGNGGSSSSGNGGDGGNGIGGSNGNVENNGTVQGGNGGSSSSGNGGNGGDGISSDNGNITNGNRGNSTGGLGGDSITGNGGNGGNGIETETGDISNDGIVSGNDGGNSDQGAGGNGGDGLNSSSGAIDNGQHSQAQGGDGGSSTTQNGGAGGNGASNQDGTTNNSGNLGGGSGGNSESGNGGSGGDGSQTDTGNITNNGGSESSGGTGGTSTSGSGGSGGNGSTSNNGDIDNNGNQSGGNGGMSQEGAGGTGGNGADSGSGSITNGTEGNQSGGDGGNSNKGPGGSGGNGVETDNGNMDNSGHINGGSGGNSTIGTGGDGGNGAVNNGAGSTNNNNGTIDGGDGGSSNKGNGGDGGSGMVADEGPTNVNGGKVDGGNGGSGTNGGNGGFGIESETGSTNLENGANVDGGTGGTGNNGTGGNGGSAVDSSGSVNVDKDSTVAAGNGGAGLAGGGKPGSIIDTTGDVDNKGNAKPGQGGPTIVIPTVPEENSPSNGSGKKPSDNTPVLPPIVKPVIPKEETPETDIGDAVIPFDQTPTRPRPRPNNAQEEERENILNMADAKVEMAGNKVNYGDLVEQSKNIVIKQDSVLQKYNITMEEAVMQLMDNGQRNALIDTVVKEGYLKALVFNTDESIIKGRIENEQQVINAMLSPIELLQVLAGDVLEFKIIITPIPDVEQNVDLLKENMQEGEILGAIVDISMYKIRNDKEDGKITETNLPVQFILDIPKEMKRADREYSLVIAHTMKNGEMEILTLKDLDNNAETITCETEKFCPALLVYTQREVVDETQTVTDEVATNTTPIVFVIALVVIVAGILFFLYRKKKEKEQGQ